MATDSAEHETAMKNEPRKEHQWLEKLVGEWTYEFDSTMEPGKPSEKVTGTEVVRSIGGLWVVGESRGEMPGGGQSTSLVTLGYDPVKKHYVGTWVGSMMSTLWVYEGKLDVAERVLTLETEGPSWHDDEKLSKYRDVIELKSDDSRTLSSYQLGDDGQWHKFMSMEYRRKS